VQFKDSIEIGYKKIIKIFRKTYSSYKSVKEICFIRYKQISRNKKPASKYRVIDATSEKG